MRPPEFWRLHPDEWWWLWDMNQPRTKYGNMTHDEARAMKRRILNNAPARARLAARGRLHARFKKPMGGSKR